MPQYEYRVIAAPNRGVKAKGISSNEARFAHALEDAMNTMAQDGWEYQRAETLPSVERSGMAASTTTWRNVLVFRRAIKSTEIKVSARHKVLKLTDPVLPKTATPTPQPRQIPAIVAPQYPEDDASMSEGASRMLSDNGVEELSEVSGISSSLKQLAESRKRSRSTG